MFQSPNFDTAVSLVSAVCAFRETNKQFMKTLKADSVVVLWMVTVSKLNKLSSCEFIISILSCWERKSSRGISIVEMRNC